MSAVRCKCAECYCKYCYVQISDITENTAIAATA